MEAVEVMLGGQPRRLALDANAMIAMAELTGDDITSVFVQMMSNAAQAAQGEGKGESVGTAKNLRIMRTLVWAMSASEHPEFLADPGGTVHQVGGWYGLQDLPRLGAAFSQLLGGLELQRPLEYPEDLAPFVPSPNAVVEAMLDLAALEDGETLIDLGAGDGRLLVKAVERKNITAIGYELHEERFSALQLRIGNHRAKDRLTVLREDIRKADVSRANVVTMYLLPRSNQELQDKLRNEMRPGTLVISHDFDMPDWPAEKTVTVSAEDGRQHKVYRYVVPEPVHAAAAAD